jgi:hypothetical protein
MAQSAFAFVCVTAPTSGAIASGPITKYVGGYENPNAMKLALLIGIACGCIAMPLPYFDNFYIVILDLWIYLFMGGLLVPLITGVYL